MRFSIIIPTLDEERVIPVTLAALVPFQFDELLVVDGGSRDRTLDIVAAFQASIPEETLTIVHASKGRSRQMNKGAAESGGDVLIFLHADTQLPADARSAIESALANPRCVGGRFDVRFEKDHGYAWVVSRMMNLRSRLSGIATGDQALFVRRAVFDQLNGFADIPIMEDIDFTKRLKRMGDMTALREKVTTSFRHWEQRGPLKTILTMWTLRFLYWIGASPHTLSRFYGIFR